MAGDQRTVARDERRAAITYSKRHSAPTAPPPPARVAWMHEKFPSARCDIKAWPAALRRSRSDGAIASLRVCAESVAAYLQVRQGETIAYQSMPCDTYPRRLGVLTISPRADASPAPVRRPASPARNSERQSAGRVWPPRRTLMLGMSDDEVLNLAGWGVPQHIVRTKARA
jgi:hypothetical protein